MQLRSIQHNLLTVILFLLTVFVMVLFFSSSPKRSPLEIKLQMDETTRPKAPV